MNSFFDRLSVKLNTGSSSSADGSPAGSSGEKNNVRTSVSVSKAPEGTGAKDPVAKEESETAEGASALNVDIFQAETRLVVFLQASGVPMEGFDITVDEDSNTVLIEGAQKRPEVPQLKKIKEGEGLEKGRFVKQEIKWGNLYRKVYLPAPVSGAEAQAFWRDGVLILVLPVRKTGEGKKLKVQEIASTENPK